MWYMLKLTARGMFYNFPSLLFLEYKVWLSRNLDARGFAVLDLDIDS